MAQEISLDFEKSILELERKIAELRSFNSDQRLNLKEEIQRLEQKAETLRHEVYENLTPWQIVQVSRHPQRPHFLDYVRGVFSRFIELHGDRAFIDDRALLGGLAWLENKPVVVIGTQKGRDTKENITHNFGLPLPEGYRKALRLMKFAEKFGLPVVSFIDTAGAFPGMEGEERGVAEAIARNLREMSVLSVPIVVVVIGEGGSGGAIGIGVGDRVLMLEYSSYMVITPEGCSAILWTDRSQAAKASELLRLTAPDLKRLGVIDEIVKEPLGGAHRDPAFVIAKVKERLLELIPELGALPTDRLLDLRYAKFRSMGILENAPASTSAGA